MKRWLLFPGLMVLAAAGSTLAPVAADAAAPVAGDVACAAGSSDDTLRPLPPNLTATAARLFGLRSMPPAQVRRSTVIRCMEGQLTVCNYGANLPCGKANTNRSLPAAEPWCRANPHSDFIPAYISGHDSIYRWRCSDGRPVTERSPAALDARGFLQAYWKRLS